GMGLSVVHEALARLQGEADLGPGPHGGTALTLIVPLAVSTRRLLLVSCRGQTYAVPLHGVEQLLAVPAGQVETVEGRPVVLLDRQPVPLVDLGHLLGLGAGQPP